MSYLLSFESGVLRPLEQKDEYDAIEEALQRCEQMRMNANVLDASIYQVKASIKAAGSAWIIKYPEKK